jgi:Uma2 family endonuclease
MANTRSLIGGPESGRRLVLDDIDWRTYSKLLRVFAERPSIRLTYDHRRLEIVSPLPEHESDADMLGRMVVVLTEELGLPIKAARSSTFRKRRKQRGLEPDNSYWITNEPRVRGKRKIDLKVDPPPDLAIEVDCTSSSLDRMEIYAVLGVAEVWRLDAGVLSFQVLDENSTHVDSTSQVFPGLKAADLPPFLSLRDRMDENTVIREFRQWVKERICDRWK